jgi:autoinducer 2 (AI-2) kinase
MLGGAAAPPAPAPDTAPPSILVTADLDAAGLERLAALGSVTHRGYKQAMRLLRGEALAQALEGVGVFVTEIDVLDAATLCGARDLRVVATCRGDAVNVDVGACTELGIPVLHAPGRNAESVADLTLAFLLMLARHLPAADAFLREPGGVAGDMARMGRAFARFQGRELGAQTVGLVGFGAVGRAVAARLRGFGTRCLACDPFVPSAEMRRAGVEPVSLATLLAESDFVSLHAPGSAGDRPLIGAAELARMKPGAFLINTARARLVDASALAEALRSGRVAGAALDVFAVEPPGADDPLLALPNVIATPHVGGNTADVATHQGRIVAAGLEQLRAGGCPPTLLNPETLERFEWGARRPGPPPEQIARLSARPAPGVTDLDTGSRRRP